MELHSLEPNGIGKEVKETYIKVKFIKGDKPAGREYTYSSEIPVNVGDKVELPGGAKGIVTAVDVPESEVAGYKDKIKTINGLADETREEKEDD